jgi:hypothetical protein
MELDVVVVELEELLAVALLDRLDDPQYNLGIGSHADSFVRPPGVRFGGRPRRWLTWIIIEDRL